MNHPQYLYLTDLPCGQFLTDESSYFSGLTFLLIMLHNNDFKSDSSLYFGDFVSESVKNTFLL